MGMIQLKDSNHIDIGVYQIPNDMTVSELREIITPIVEEINEKMWVYPYLDRIGDLDFQLEKRGIVRVQTQVINTNFF